MVQIFYNQEFSIMYILTLSLPVFWHWRVKSSSVSHSKIVKVDCGNEIVNGIIFSLVSIMGMFFTSPWKVQRSIDLTTYTSSPLQYVFFTVSSFTILLPPCVVINFYSQNCLFHEPITCFCLLLLVILGLNCHVQYDVMKCDVIVQGYVMFCVVPPIR